MSEMVELKKYEFRELGAKDMFLMFNIISKIGINEFATVFETGGIVEVIKGMSEDDKASDNGAMVAVAAVAMDIAHIILSNIGKCEDDIYKLLAQTSNLTVKEITAQGNAVMFLEMVIDFCRKEEFPAFFKAVSKLFK